MITAEVIIEDIKDEIQQGKVCLPVLPNVYLELENLIQKERPISEMVLLISKDLALTSRVLQISNSAAFSKGMPIVSLDEALMRLGTNFVKTLILCAYMKDKFSVSGRYKMKIKYLWEHSAILAYLCEHGVKEFKNRVNNVEPGLALTISLLHDIGYLPIVSYLDKYDISMDLNQFFEYKKQIGNLIATKWALPEIFKESCDIPLISNNTLISFVSYMHQLVPNDQPEVDISILAMKCAIAPDELAKFYQDNIKDAISFMSF